jgi:hypothetical protein
MTRELGKTSLIWPCFHPHPIYRYSTRDAFMIKVMSKQNFTQYPYIVKQLKEVEAMFEEIQKLHRLIF